MSEQSNSPMDDPQTHVDTDPVNAPDSNTGADPDVAKDTRSDPARHANDEDEGWESEGGATPKGPATDT